MLTTAPDHTLEVAPHAKQDTFTSLDHCHRQILTTLQRLGELIERLDRHGVDAQASDIAREVVHFFNETARQHHADEEQQVFPALLGSANAQLVQHVKRLQQDHGWLEEDWLMLEPPLSAIADGYNWYDLDMLRRALPVFADLYQDHIELEDSLVYPEARLRQLRDDSSRARVARAA